MLFASPWVLWLLALVPAVAFLHARAALLRRRALERFAGPLHPRLASASATRRAARSALLLGALFLVVVALARPRFGREIEEVPIQGLDLMVGLDLSTSMLSEDVPPNRLTVAKSEIASLIDRLRGDRVGVIGFAGVPFVACPLTADYGAAKMFLEALQPDVMPVPGTAIGAAIRKAMESFGSEERRYKVLVLVTDGEDHGADELKAADEAARAGMRLYTIGIGQTRGAPIPIKDASGNVTGYKKDKQGEVVVSRLDAEGLARMAEATGGAFFQATRDQAELDAVVGGIKDMQRREIGIRRIDHLSERYQIFAGLALALLLVRAAIPVRAAALALLLAVFLAPMASPVAAQGVLDERRAHQEVEEGSDHYREGRFDASLDAFARAQTLVPQSSEIAFDVATAAYKKALAAKEPKERNEGLARAIDLYTKVVNAADPKLRARASFGMGNAAFHSGKLEQSATYFEKSLEDDPSDLDCKRNLELVRRMLAPRPDQPRPSPSAQPSPSPSSQPSPSPSGQPSPSPSSRASQTPSSQPSPRPGASPSPEPSPSPAPRPSATPSPAAQPQEEPSPTASPRPSPEPSSVAELPPTTSASPSPGTTQDVSRVLESLKEEVSSIRELYRERLKKVPERPVEVDW